METVGLKSSFENDGTRLREALLAQRLVRSDAALADTLIGAGKLVGCQKGAVLYEEGSTFAGVYFVLHGEIELTRDGTRLSTIEASNVVGEWPILSFDPTYKVTATARSNAVLFLVEGTTFRTIALAHPKLWQRLAEDQAARLRKTSAQSIAMSAGDCDVLVVVALREEAQTFTDHFSDCERVNAAIPHWRGTLRVGGRALTIRIVTQMLMGGIEAASLVTRAIYMTRPKAIVMTGIMGGFKNQRVSLGDVIIAKEAFDYGFGKLQESKRPPAKSSRGKRAKQPRAREDFFRDPRFVAIDATLGQKVNNWLLSGAEEHLERTRDEFFKKVGARPRVSPKFGSRIHYGPVASGSLVVASETKIAEIVEIHRHTYGVEMEIAGVLHAARACSIPAVAIKGVSDLADSQKDRAQGTDAKYARRFAAFASMATARALMEQNVVP